MDHVELIDIGDALLSRAAPCIPCIPRILHLVWVGTAPQPDYVATYVAEWRALMPAWQVRLWTNADITDAEFPPDIVAKVAACTKGAQAADILRYFIIHKHGGVYLDTDVTPHRALDPIVDMGRPIVLCHDLALSWPYVINGFFAAAPAHPLLDYACRLCADATINTSDVHLHTGPRVLGEAVWRVKPEPTELYVLLHAYYFYRNRVGDLALDGVVRTTDVDTRFGTHFYAKSWT